MAFKKSELEDMSLDELQKLVGEKGLTKVEMIKRLMPRNTKK